MSLEYDFEKLLKSMHCNNFLNKMQKRLYNKIVANQQILEISKILISLATKLKMQLSSILKESLKCRTLQSQKIYLANSGTPSETKFKN